jgi:hypothetical protein
MGHKQFLEGFRSLVDQNPGVARQFGEDLTHDELKMLELLGTLEREKGQKKALDALEQLEESADLRIAALATLIKRQLAQEAVGGEVARADRPQDDTLDVLVAAMRLMPQIISEDTAVGLGFLNGTVLKCLAILYHIYVARSGNYHFDIGSIVRPLAEPKASPLLEGADPKYLEWLHSVAR